MVPMSGICAFKTKKDSNLFLPTFVFLTRRRKQKFGNLQVERKWQGERGYGLREEFSSGKDEKKEGEGD